MKLLVSVRDAQEAIDAATGGADWIDLKEPLRGPLGAVNSTTAQAALNAIKGRCSISAALGELIAGESSSELLTIPGIEVVKLGLAECGQLVNWQSLWIAAFENCSHHGKHLAAVIYADWRCAGAPTPEAVLECAYRAGAKYLLIDTFDKLGLSSIEILGRDLTVQLLQLARLRGLTTVLAGSLRVNNLPVVVTLPVDVVAIRGAACGGERHSTLDLARVRHFRRQLEIVSEKAKELNSRLTTRS